MGEHDSERHPYLRQIAKNPNVEQAMHDIAMTHVDVATGIYKALFVNEYNRATEAAIIERNVPRLLETGDDEGIRAAEVSEHLALCCARLANLSVQAADALMVALGFAVLPPDVQAEIERRNRRRREFQGETDDDEEDRPRRPRRRPKDDEDDDDPNDKSARWPPK